MASFFNHILAPFSPLCGRLSVAGGGNDSKSDGSRGSAAVAAGAAGGLGIAGRAA